MNRQHTVHVPSLGQYISNSYCSDLKVFWPQKQITSDTITWCNHSKIKQRIFLPRPYVIDCVDPDGWPNVKCWFDSSIRISRHTSGITIFKRGLNISILFLKKCRQFREFCFIFCDFGLCFLLNLWISTETTLNFVEVFGWIQMLVSQCWD